MDESKQAGWALVPGFGKHGGAPAAAPAGMSQGLKRASTSDPDEGSHEAEDDHEQLDSVHKRQTKNK